MSSFLWSQEKVMFEISQKEQRYDVAIILNQRGKVNNANQFKIKADRGKFVHEELVKAARQSQTEVIEILEQKGIPYQRFYVVNMIVTNLDLTTAKEIARLSTVKSIIPNSKISLLEPIKNEDASLRTIEWGVQKIRAPEVWAMGFTGQGVVVAGQDTGYDWDHPAIKNQYRGWDGMNASHDYNWHDAIHTVSGTNPCGSDSPEPCDDNNHGTHTMGTMVGDDGGSNQIGVAPGAKWIACRNMDRGNGTLSTYIECFEWLMAPYPIGGNFADDGDPSKAPHVINNSWACPPEEGCNETNFSILEEALNNLRNSGVVVVASNGNSGRGGCETTLNPPAFYNGAFSIGATNSSDLMADFSSRGPVTYDGSGRLKPNVVAPGVSVRSAIRDGGYASFNGTSMAGPHVAGAVALMISANPTLAGQVEKIESILEETAVPITSSQECGGLLPAQIPNYVFGYGRIDVKAAVDRALNELYVPIIKVDQFGYAPDATKYAILSNPIDGYNSSDIYNPPAAIDLRDALTHQTVFSGSPELWSFGNKDIISGDQVWWFEFSDFTTPGTYYISDNTHRSENFEIGEDAYHHALKAAFKSFYYQRCGIAKSSPFADPGYNDAICHAQDVTARSVLDQGNATLETDVSGGWHDAGDYNKYVNFAYPAVIDMLMAYEMNPQSWNDGMDIPESGNGIPDLLDELKVELDWLLKMQQTDGGVLSVVGTLNYNGATPPSADNNNRYYGPKTTSASFSAASMFALGALQFRKIDLPLAQSYAATLENAAIDAYNWAIANPGVTFQNTSYVLAAGEQEINAYEISMRQLAAEIYLYSLTGIAQYKTNIETSYTNAHMIQWPHVYPYEMQIQYALLYYSSIKNISLSVRNNILNAYKNSIDSDAQNLPTITGNQGAYRAFLDPSRIGWGSNREHCNKGNMYQAYRHFDLDTMNDSLLLVAIEDYIHYMHGINPNALCFLTNMENFGAQRSVNTIYHGWFSDGHPLWDDVRTSTYGPPPGFIPGGPNPGWSLDPSACPGNPECINQVPPDGQPALKSYYDWNASWPQNSWSVTENAIYYQSAYLLLLSSRIENISEIANPSNLVRVPSSDYILNTSGGGIVLTAPDMSKYLLNIDNSGSINTTLIPSSPLENMRIIDGSLYFESALSGQVVKSPDNQLWKMDLNNAGDLRSNTYSTILVESVQQASGYVIIENPEHGIILKDKDGFCSLFTVNNSGSLIKHLIVCP